MTMGISLFLSSYFLHAPRMAHLMETLASLDGSDLYTFTIQCPFSILVVQLNGRFAAFSL